MRHDNEKCLANADRAKLSASARAMYLDGRVALCRAEEAARKADRGRGYVSPVEKAVLNKKVKLDATIN